MTPDIPPNTAGPPITYQAYDYWTPGWAPVTHKIVPGVEFHVFVSATGHRFSVRYDRPLVAL